MEMDTSMHVAVAVIFLAFTVLMFAMAVIANKQGGRVQRMFFVGFGLMFMVLLLVELSKLPLSFDPILPFG